MTMCEIQQPDINEFIQLKQELNVSMHEYGFIDVWLPHFIHGFTVYLMVCIYVTLRLVFPM